MSSWQILHTQDGLLTIRLLCYNILFLFKCDSRTVVSIAIRQTLFSSIEMHF